MIPFVEYQFNTIKSPEWVNVLSALLTPTIAIAGLLLGWFTYRLESRRRRDDLFDRRYGFYKRVESMWLKTGSGAAAGQRPWLDTEDLIPIAQEAGFLFGKDISDHILSLADKEHTGSPFFADGDFTEPFCKYLYLGR